MSKLFPVVIILCIGVPLLTAGRAQARPSSDGSNNVVHSLSRSTANRLKSVQSKIKKGKYQAALNQLNDLGKSVQDDLYASAVVERLTASVFLAQGKYSKALPHLRTALETGALPKQLQHRLRLTMAQLYAAKGKYQRTLDILTQWFESEKSPSTAAYELAATTYYTLKQYEPARKYIKLTMKSGDEPQKQWYSLLVGIDFHLHHYDEAINALTRAVTYWPDEDSFWKHLYGLYLLTKQSTNAMRVMQVAYEKGIIENGSDLLNLARLELGHGMPYYAAKVIAQGLDKGTIDPSLENLKLLVAAWTQAREINNALAVLERAPRRPIAGRCI